ncbi:MAG: HAD-IC family P-type ATPase, partial [Alphaproteobacteria bacterium]|nr:HAD-IC family P-type ATPase [Alphaproteobacteria bacterium]
MILGFRLGIYEALPALCFLAYGKDILKNGWKNLIHKTPNMDTLIGIGVIASFGYSLFNLWKGNIEHLYFESSAIIIYFVKLGRYIDGINKEKTKSAIQKLVTITPALAVLKKDDVEQRITIDEIKKGDIVIARPGDKVAVDGEIVIGNAHFDESFISGESVPVVRSVGDKVLAGSLNYDGYIEYKAEKIGKNSMVSEIVKLVAKATATKTPMTKIADKISGYFVPMVIIIAFLTLGLNLLLQQGLNTAFVSFVCVLVVACPCALGLATPLAVVAAEGLCLKKGILVKSSELFETAAKVNVAVFDKTGTLTYGRLRVAKITNLSSETDDFVMQLAGSLESMSNHPVSRAFVEYMAVHKLDKLKIKSFENFDGMGVKGKVNEKNVV